ncbi:MAG: DUF4139 domain-containing protein [Candidatus Eisenbacteria bacterium]
MHGRIPARAMALAACTAALLGLGPGSVRGAEREVTVTVYNSNLALVKDVRTLDIGTGRKTLRFADVSAQIDPTSVHLTPQGGGALAVLEQNFQYDLVSADRVLERYKDRELTVIGKDGKSTTGVLLSFDGASLVLDRRPGIAIINRTEVKEIQFPELPGGLITRPTLVWLVDNAGAAQRQTQISYLTTGMSWHAEYVAVIAPDDRALSWAGWVSLENTSGTDYPEAKLKLVAGDVNRVQDERTMQMKGRVLQTMDGVDASQFQEQTFFEYHLYTLSRPTTLADKETKQLALFPTAAVTAAKNFTYERMRHPTKVRVSMEFRNSASAGLGMPLPMGKVRVYKEEKSGAQEFVGEDRIGHTAKDESVRLTIGDAFDVVGEYRQVATRRISDREVETSHEIKIRNRKSERITVKVVERQWGDWRVMEASQDHVKKDATTLEFTVDVAPDQEKVVTYTVRQR